jgi:hypothetical protein
MSGSEAVAVPLEEPGTGRPDGDPLLQGIFLCAHSLTCIKAFAA